MFLGGQNYTSFRAVRVKDNLIRFAGTDPYAGTLTVGTLVGGRAWTLPDTSGTIGMCGTISVNLEAIAASTVYQTIVDISGLRADDSLVATIQGGNTTYGTRGFYVLSGVRAIDGAAYLTFFNCAPATATIPETVTLAYARFR